MFLNKFLCLYFICNDQNNNKAFFLYKAALLVGSGEDYLELNGAEILLLSVKIIRNSNRKR